MGQGIFWLLWTQWDPWVPTLKLPGPKVISVLSDVCTMVSIIIWTKYEYLLKQWGIAFFIHVSTRGSYSFNSSSVWMSFHDFALHFFLPFFPKKVGRRQRQNLVWMRRGGAEIIPHCFLFPISPPWTNTLSFAPSVCQQGPQEGYRGVS